MKITVADSETDPFKHGRTPKPFVWGYYDGEDAKHFWGEDCTERFVEFLYTQDKQISYVHNGGKFDFIFLLPYLDQNLTIINNRIVKCKIGNVELRDSYAILPIPLSAYNKIEIDYNKMEAENREQHKEEILRYLLDGDCVYLHTLVKAFVEEFGTRLTIGGTAVKALKKFHSYDKCDSSMSEKFDAPLRKYYYGGRCECFQTGVLKGNWKVYDMNSQYPNAMERFLHPVGNKFNITKEITDNTAFATIRACSNGALPLRAKNGSIIFPHGEHIFHASIHEIRVGLKTGQLEIREVIEAVNFYKFSKFDTFVDHYVDKKIAAELAGDKVHRLFYKLVLNSGYGRTAINPENQWDYIIIQEGDFVPASYELDLVGNGFSIWRREPRELRYENVAIGASITGASRSTLFEALLYAKNPVYSDTDSIICEALPGVKIHDTELGAWKCEGEGDKIAIAGKKLYALFDGKECIKIASKGARLKPSQILGVARGKQFTYYQDAPTFDLSGKATFMHREIKRTYTKPAIF